VRVQGLPQDTGLCVQPGGAHGGGWGGLCPDSQKKQKPGAPGKGTV
jgi:hypothetical protein